MSRPMTSHLPTSCSISTKAYRIDPLNLPQKVSSGISS